MRAARLALVYAADEMHARGVVIKVLAGNTASLRCRVVGLVPSRSVLEPSDRGGTFVVFRRELVADRA